MKGVPCTQKSKMVRKICPEMGSTFSTTTSGTRDDTEKLLKKL